jgi:hypothetical protein
VLSDFFANQALKITDPDKLVFGPSLERQITDALRAAGLLREREVLMTDSQKFDMSHPDFSEWCDQVDASMDDGDCTASTVIDKLIELGFTVIPPPMPRYAVLYNGRTIIRTDTKEQAEHALRGLHNRTAWEIKDMETPGG